MLLQCRSTCGLRRRCARRRLKCGSRNAGTLPTTGLHSSCWVIGNRRELIWDEPERPNQCGSTPMNERGAATAAARATELQNLLVRLDSDWNRAGEKYEELRRTLIKFFEWNSCFPAEDLVDETLDRVAKKLDVEEVRNV